MDVIFKNSKHSKISDSHRLLLNLSDKINVKRSHKCIVLSIICMEKYLKNYTTS